jgi:integrase
MSGASPPPGLFARVEWEARRRRLAARTAQAYVHWTRRFVACLLYGGGLRILEALRLRVQEVDLERGEITVRSAKGDKDRRTSLPAASIGPLRAHLDQVRRLFEKDLESEWCGVRLPYALARKYPAACREWSWQWLFPAGKLARDPETGLLTRHHLRPQIVQRGSARPLSAPASTSAPPATPCVTPSRPTCSSAARTSAPCRSSSAARSPPP